MVAMIVFGDQVLSLIPKLQYRARFRQIIFGNHVSLVDSLDDVIFVDPGFTRTINCATCRNKIRTDSGS